MPYLVMGYVEGAGTLPYTQSPYDLAVLADSPIMYYPTQDPAGSTQLYEAVSAENKGTFYSDLNTPNDNSKIDFERTGPTVGGATQKALRFRETGYFRVPNIDMSNIPSTGISIEFNYKYGGNDVGGNKYIFQVGADSVYNFGFMAVNGQYRHSPETWSNNFYSPGYINYTVNQWYHTVIRWASNRNVTVYQNGTLVAQKTFSTQSQFPSNSVLYIGSNSGSIDFEISNFAVYEGLISTTQMNNHRNAS